MIHRIDDYGDPKIRNALELIKRGLAAENAPRHDDEETAARLKRACGDLEEGCGELVEVGLAAYDAATAIEDRLRENWRPEPQPYRQAWS